MALVYVSGNTQRYLSIFWFSHGAESSLLGSHIHPKLYSCLVVVLQKGAQRLVSLYESIKVMDFCKLLFKHTGHHRVTSNALHRIKYGCGDILCSINQIHVSIVLHIHSRK